jgi:hypothetical protein
MHIFWQVLSLRIREKAEVFKARVEVRDVGVVGDQDARRHLISAAAAQLRQRLYFCTSKASKAAR